MDFVFVRVHSGGSWHDCSYIGDTTLDVPILRYDISIYSLRYNISNYCSFLGADFNIFYLKTSWGRSRVKSRLTTDEQLQWLLSTDSAPTVYVCPNEGASSSHADESSSL
ncbi:hypothetical protein OROHE_018406 [Orobanche hederae]